MNVKVRGETEPTPVQLFLAAGESDQATSGHVFMDKVRTMMSANIPVMVCEDVHATLMKGALLQRDVNDLSQTHFTAVSELIIWPGECLPSHRTVRMSTVFLCCVFCILMLSVLVQAVPCAEM